MKSFCEYIIEAIADKAFDSSQIHDLYNEKINIEAFAINNGIEKEEAQKIKNLCNPDTFSIISTEQMYEQYDNKIVDKCLDQIDDLVKKGPRYSDDIGLSDEEQKKRDELKKQVETSSLVEGEEQPSPKKDDVEFNESIFVEDALNDFVGKDKKYVQQYFWKKSNDNGYLYFIFDDNDDIKKLISKL